MGKGRHHIGEEIVCTTRNSREYVGEQDASELEECILNPETRHIEQIIVTDSEETSKLFEIFMGTPTAPRKEWILEHSEEAEEY